MSLAKQRGRWERDLPSITQTVYLNSAGQGPKPRCAAEEMAYWYGKTFLYGACVKPLLGEINRQVEETRRIAAGFFRAEPDEVAWLRCIAEGVNTLLDGMEWKLGDEIITSTEENPALLIPLQQLAKRTGVVIRKIELPGQKSEILDHLEHVLSWRTRLVIMSHVTHTRGLRIPVREMANLCHQYGAYLALDGAQAAGQVPADLSELGCDCYLAAGYKWLLGFHGTAIAVIRRPLAEKLDQRYGGVGSQKWFDFETDRFEWKEEVSRLEYGSRHWPLYLALGKSLEYLSGIGIGEIEDHVWELRGKLISEMEGLGFFCESPRKRELSSGIVTFSKAGLPVEKLTAWLYQERNILVQFRNFSRYTVSPQGLRVSLAFFNTEEEVGKLVEGIKEFISQEAKRSG